MPLRLIDSTAPTPAENLALEEAILDAVETGASPSTLRLWESPIPFVVLGVSQVLADEVDEPGCAAEGVPILRRCTAGGAVLQGPGSFNYALTLRYEDYPETRVLRASYDYILGRLADAFAARAFAVAPAGCSDLAIGGRKISGNAQKRRKHAFLHHGTLLHAVDAGLFARCLREPKQRPDYRGDRAHEEFVTALPMEPGALRACVCDAFGTSNQTPESITENEQAAMASLARAKYADDAWTRRR